MRHFRAQDSIERLYEGLGWQRTLGQLKNHRKATNATCYISGKRDVLYLGLDSPRLANFKAEARRKLVDLACFDD